MTPQEARTILLSYRPGRAEEHGPELAEALALANRDPELGRWLKEHLALQEKLRSAFQSIQPPPGLKDRILAQPKIVRPATWHFRPAWLAAAAAFAVLALVAAVLWQPEHPERFANFRARMVSTALRQYRMDIVTNDMNQVRQFIASKGAPGDYEIPPGLRNLQLTGGGTLTWRSNPVGMVCFDRGDKQMLFLFVMNTTALPDPPSQNIAVEQLHNLETVSWTAGGKTYVLSGLPEPDFARKYLGKSG